MTHTDEEHAMNWLWAYFRRKTMESILAGVHDALASGGNAGLSDEQAARAAQAIAGGMATTDPSAGKSGGAVPHLASADAPSSAEPAAAAEVRRGPGRPRKFQEPPQ